LLLSPNGFSILYSPSLTLFYPLRRTYSRLCPGGLLSPSLPNLTLPSSYIPQCAIFSLTGLIFLLSVGHICSSQPIYVKGFTDPDVQSDTCFKGSILYAITLGISVFLIAKNNINDNDSGGREFSEVEGRNLLSQQHHNHYGTH